MPGKDKTIKPMVGHIPNKVLGGGLKDNKQDKMSQAPLHGVKTRAQTTMDPYKKGK